MLLSVERAAVLLRPICVSEQYAAYWRVMAEGIGRTWDAVRGAQQERKEFEHLRTRLLRAGDEADGPGWIGAFLEGLGVSAAIALAASRGDRSHIIEGFEGELANLCILVCARNDPMYACDHDDPDVKPDVCAGLPTPGMDPDDVVEREIEQVVVQAAEAACVLDPHDLELLRTRLRQVPFCCADEA